MKMWHVGELGGTSTNDHHSLPGVDQIVQYCRVLGADTIAQQCGAYRNREKTLRTEMQEVEAGVKESGARN